MALSKPSRDIQRISKIDWDKNVTISLDKNIIIETCKIVYTNAISVEIIEHLFGGQNMEYIPMELENSIDCYAFCRRDLLDDINNKKEEILYFEDRNCETYNTLLTVIKQKKSNTKREHVILKAVVRVTVNVEPKIAICRYFIITGQLVSHFFPYRSKFVTESL